MRKYRELSMFLFGLCPFVVTAAGGCKSRIPEPEAKPAAVKDTPAAQAPAKPAAESAPPKVAPAAPIPRAGWSVVSLHNNLSLCLFGDTNEREAVQTVVNVKKQVLQADRPIALGVFAPHCINPDCDEVSSLQCSVVRSGNTLRVETRYAGLHKDGTTCTTACQDVRAGCESPSLEPGQYTIEYGTNEIPLKIPSALNLPCFTKH